MYECCRACPRGALKRLELSFDSKWTRETRVGCFSSSSLLFGLKHNSIKIICGGNDTRVDDKMFFFGCTVPLNPQRRYLAKPQMLLWLKSNMQVNPCIVMQNTIHAVWNQRPVYLMTIKRSCLYSLLLYSWFCLNFMHQLAFW